jgi:hypothetical protein
MAERPEDDHLEMLCYLAHYLDRQGRFADAPQAQYAHHPAAILDHPLAQLSLLLFASIEAWAGQCCAAIQPWRRLWLSHGQLTWSGCLL